MRTLFAARIRGAIRRCCAFGRLRSGDTIATNVSPPARRHFPAVGWGLASLLATSFAAGTAVAAPSDYFVIHVVDAETGRGVPLVELRTTNEISYTTDSAGTIAFLEPGLMDRKVFFTISSPGYEFAADGFGFHGSALETVPGRRTTLKIKRINIAERLYRVTGAGIYRDSILAGDAVPIREPLLNGGVAGQDSVLAVPYRGAVHWLWGDTLRPEYPLGNFGMSGAVSSRTLDANKGVDLTYFTDSSGFSRPMIPIKRPGPVWITGLHSIEGGSRLIGYYSRMERLDKAVERGLALYNDATDTFEPVILFETDRALPIDGHPFLVKQRGTAPAQARRGGPSANSVAVSTGQPTLLVGTREGALPYPCVRVIAELAALKDISRYETYTCLRYGPGNKALPDRDPSGKLIYAWKRNAPCLTVERQQKLIAAGAIKPEEGMFQMRDVQTGKRVRTHAGSVYWNGFRGRWVMIFGEAGGGVSNVGEIWFTEADTAVGPWVYARKIASHPGMDFYNPTQHPFLDEEEGKRIYFEGTYVNTFSGNPIATPRYNYNEIMYRVTLDDPRLILPTPVYRMVSGEFKTRNDLRLPAEAVGIRSIPFYAPRGDRAPSGMVAIFESRGEFTTTPPSASSRPMFLALAPNAPNGAANLPLKDRSGRLLGYVWRNPQSVLTLDFSLEQVPEG